MTRSQTKQTGINMKKIHIQNTSTSKVVTRMRDGRAITAHTTVQYHDGKPFHAIAYYTLEGCGLSFPSKYSARVHATMINAAAKQEI